MYNPTAFELFNPLQRELTARADHCPVFFDIP
jgi:hypothetical protein